LDDSDDKKKGKIRRGASVEVLENPKKKTVGNHYKIWKESREFA
jgi:hypothetical protein